MPLGPGDYRLIAESLRDRGLYLTAQRRAVCEAVFGCPGHVCAEHILSLAAERQPRLRMNKTTVYRTLATLVDLGLVQEHQCGGERAQYEPSSRGRHSHLLCTRCGTLHNLDRTVATDLQRQLSSHHGFVAELESYPILGLCAECGG